jgi:hypothetical protein
VGDADFLARQAALEDALLEQPPPPREDLSQAAKSHQERFGD